jgi:hypothetical protein
MKGSTLVLWLVLLAMHYHQQAATQSSRILASSFVEGTGRSSTSLTNISTSLGESLAGNTSSPSTTIAGGFLGGSPPGESGLSLAVQTSWNLLSVPLTVTDYSKTVLFPTATSDAFAYQGGYTSQPVLQNGQGYWLKFGAPQSLFLGGQLRSLDSILVLPGWNLVGSISQSVPVASIQSVPPGLATSSFFGYSTGGYGIASSIDPGQGYWVKVTTGGKLVLTTAQTAPESRITILPSSELPPPPPESEADAVAGVPAEFALEQNFPNPFNPETAIRFQITDYGRVRLVVYDLLGRQVATLVDEYRDRGTYSVKFDASNLASGTYIYRLTASGLTATRRMMLVK